MVCGTRKSVHSLAFFCQLKSQQSRFGYSFRVVPHEVQRSASLFSTVPHW